VALATHAAALAGPGLSPGRPTQADTNHQSEKKYAGFHVNLLELSFLWFKWGAEILAAKGKDTFYPFILNQNEAEVHPRG
jgi:hypothetical protein